jgi:hypothetical protein
MGNRKFRFTNEQVKRFIKKQKEIDEATTTATAGNYTYDAPAFNAKKGDDFWKDSLEHNKKGGISCETV